MTSQIDDNLKRYYSDQGKVYGRNDNGDGKFKEWADDNGYDTDEIRNDLQDKEPCCVDFDENFPLLDQETDRTKQIVGIINRCLNEKNPDFSKQIHVLFSELCEPQTFEISEEQKQIYHDIYQKQCPAIYKSSKDDSSFFTALMIGRIHKVEYIQHLFDLYMRDSVGYYKDEGKILRVSDWTKQYPYFQRLEKNSSDIAEAALKSFSARICPQLQFNTTTKIQDSLEETTKYIFAALQFVTRFAESGKKTCPFQVDVCIAFPKTIKVADIDDIDDEGTGSDEDGDVDYGQKDTEQKMNLADCIGDIEARLKRNKLQSVHEVEAESMKPTLTRRMHNLFRQFNETIKSDQNPRGKRFITVVDRRKRKDKVIMFEPPPDVRDIPVNAVPEWYFNASKTCIIPNLEEDEKENDPKIKKLKNTVINSRTHCNGTLLTLSFHVKESDSIKCYLYWNGQIIRFLPSDIMDILPLMFDMKFGDNREFEENENIKDEIKMVKDKLVDREFNAFKNALFV